MYPDLSYIFHALIGTEPDNWTSIFKTFGMFLVLAFLTAAWFFYIELKRKAGEGKFKAEKVKTVVGRPASVTDIISNAIFGFIVGFKFLYIFQNFGEFKNDAAGVLLSLKGEWWAGILLAIVFGGFRYWEGKKNALSKPKEVTHEIWPHDRIGDLTVMAAISGILGAKIFDIFDNFSNFLNDPIGVFFSGSGLAIYGGVICGFLGVTWYMRKHEIPFKHALDALAPAFVFAYGVGRLGCQFSGDGDWGIVADTMPEWWFFPEWLWAFDYPHNVNNDGILIADCAWNYCSKLPEAVYPTPIYEVFASLLIGGFLWAIRKRVQIAGMLFFMYLILNGVQRFFIEIIRVNVQHEFLGMNPSQAQIIAVVFVLIGITGSLYLKRQAGKEA